MKNRILATAREVFLKKGIHKSTVRDIAKELSISDGHLRYYFKTKEDLILAVFSQMDKMIADFAHEKKEQQNNPIDFLVGPLTQSFEVMYRYAFFFTESTALFDLYPKLNAAYRNLIDSRRALFLGLFKKFKEQRIFMEDVDESLFPLLFEQFFIISDNWVKYAEMQAEKDPVNHYVALSMALFLPFFNPQIKMDALRWIKSNVSKTT